MDSSAHGTGTHFSHVVDFSGRNNVQLNFRHAYRPYFSSDRDSLLVYVSTDGGQKFSLQGIPGSRDRFWKILPPTFPWEKNFVPNLSTDWCGGNPDFAPCNTIDLSQFDGMGNVRLAFEVFNDFGNNIYLG